MRFQVKIWCASAGISECEYSSCCAQQQMNLSSSWRLIGFFLITVLGTSCRGVHSTLYVIAEKTKHTSKYQSFCNPSETEEKCP